MPRPRKSVSDTEAVVAAPRKRVSRSRVVGDGDGITPSPKRRVVKKAVTSPVDVPTSGTRVLRKAPTPVAAQNRTREQKRVRLLIVVGLSIVLTGAGIAIGFSDTGVIDVVASVNEQNEKINRGEVKDASGATVTGLVPVQNIGNVPNGGFKIDDSNASQNEQPPAPEQNSATSTEPVSSSTEATVDAEPSSADISPVSINENTAS